MVKLNPLPLINPLIYQFLTNTNLLSLIHPLTLSFEGVLIQRNLPISLLVWGDVGDTGGKTILFFDGVASIETGLALPADLVFSGVSEMKFNFFFVRKFSCMNYN